MLKGKQDVGVCVRVRVAVCVWEHVIAQARHLHTVGYVCYLKEVNEQTTAASITEEQEHEEWEENERDEEKKSRSTACAHLGLCGVCHGSVPQMKMRRGGR